MKRRVRGRRLALLFSLAFLILLTGCGGGLPAASWFGVTAAEDVVYLAANQQVFAIDLEDGDVLWSFPSEPDSEIGPFYATPLLKNDLVVVGGFGDGKLYGLSRDSGDAEWVIETGAPIVGGAVAIDGGIMVANNKGEVYLVDDGTQALRLLLEADAAIWAKPLVDEANNRVYVASMDHHLYALDLEREELLWAFDADGALVGTPALRDGVMFVGALTNTFFAIDVETGDELKRFETEGWVWGGPLVSDDTVFFGDMDGVVYALDAAGLSEPEKIFKAEQGVRVTPVLADGTLYFGARGGQVYALGVEDSQQQWPPISVGGSIYSQPVVRDDTLLVSPHNAKVQLVALSREKSGAERWTYPPREE